MSCKLAYSVEEAAELLSVSRAHLYRLLDTGKLESIRIGRSRRITHGQLTAFISTLEAQHPLNLLRERCEDGAELRLGRGSKHGKPGR